MSPQDLPASTFPSDPGVIGTYHHIGSLRRCWTWVFLLTQQTLTLSHLPTPTAECSCGCHGSNAGPMLEWQALYQLSNLSSPLAEFLLYFITIFHLFYTCCSLPSLLTIPPLLYLLLPCLHSERGRPLKALDKAQYISWGRTELRPLPRIKTGFFSVLSFCCCFFSPTLNTTYQMLVKQLTGCFEQATVSSLCSCR